MKIIKYRFLLPLVLGLVLIVALSASVSAHSELVKSDPAANAVLGTPPTEVKLWYDQPVDIQFSRVQVLDANHNRVDVGTLQYVSADHKEISAALKPLSDGSYIVLWTAFSATDGHITRGNFAFSVGNVAGPVIAPAPPAPIGESETSPVSVAARWLNLIAMFALIGGLYFRVLLLNRGLALLGYSHEKIESNRLTFRWRRLVFAALILALLSALLGILVEASAIANVSLIDALGVQPLSQTLFNTNVGILWLVRNGLVILIAILLFIPRRVFNTLLPLLVGTAALVTFSLGSHNAAVAGDISPYVLSDWLHLIAVSVWVGGLFHFFLAVLSAPRVLRNEERSRWIAWMVPQFSTIGIVVTAVIAFTGLLSTLIQVNALDEFLTTAYGETLGIKIALFLAMLGFGALNLLWLSPRFRKTVNAPEQSNRVFSRFRLTVGGEVLLGLAVLFFASLLTLLPPARAAQEQQHQQQQASSANPNAPAFTYLDEQVSAGNANDPAQTLHVELTIRPDFSNPTDYDARITDSKTTTPLTDVLRVIYAFTYLDSDAGITQANADARADGHYTVTGNETPLDGMWLIRIIVRRRGLDDVTATFPIIRGTATITNDAQAMAMLQQSDAAMNALTSVHSRQVLNDGTNGSLVTDYQYQAPDKMRFDVEGENSSIAIGANQFYQGQDGSWTEQTRIEPLVFPNFTNAKDSVAASFGRIDYLNNVPMQIIRFRISAASGTPIDYAGWISQSDKRLQQFAMVTTAHYMVQTYEDFNGSDIAIAAPTNLATPTPVPAVSNVPAPTSPARIPGFITGDLESDIALGVMVIGIVSGVLSSNRKRSRRWRLGVLGIAVVLIGLSLYLFVDAVNAQQAIANAPVDVNAANAGQKIYDVNCTACHGATGHGDGPAGKSLPVQPFDLTTHVLLHDEQYLQAVVANGRGYMPAWKEKLNPLQIQQVIAYARQLAFQARAASGTPAVTPGFTPGP